MYTCDIWYYLKAEYHLLESVHLHLCVCVHSDKIDKSSFSWSLGETTS